jgi:hypothetical protein
VARNKLNNNKSDKGWWWDEHMDGCFDLKQNREVDG